MTRFSALTIRRIVHALTIITLLTIMLSAAKTHTVTSVVKGIATTLSCTITAPDIPCHDQSLGQTVFEIKSKGAARPFGRIVLDERWQCAGFSSNGYVLLGFWETGSVVTLNGIRYWRESEKQPTISKFERDDSSAAAGTFSADLRFYAFVNMGGGLFILDLVRDDTRALGDAPSPPPVPKEDRESFLSNDKYWSWTSYILYYGYFEPDSSILSFKRHTLIATYGKDTLKKRSATRRKKSWDGDMLFAAKQPH